MDCYPLKQTMLGHTSRLFGDLLYHFDRVQAFYNFNPFDPDSYSRAARQVNYPADFRAAVSDVLAEQAAAFGATHEACATGIARLRRGALAVVTGQQVGLFGGPALAVYKALTAARLAARLTERGLDCVPVFWLATEDHDLAEANHTYLLDAAGQPQRLTDPGAPHVAGAPVGQIQLSAEIGNVVEKAVGLLPESPWRQEAAEALRAAYRPAETFGSAFGRLMARLLQRFGIVLLDPADTQLRQLAAGVFRRALESAEELRAAVLARNKELLRAGYHAQVHVGEQSIFLFVDRQGRRMPLRRANHDLLAGNERFSLRELLALLDERPDSFSPNALLRPVVQDTLLPTVAYVGGPAELAYLAQAAPLYDRLLGRMPVVFPRSGFTLLDPRTPQLLDRYRISVSDVTAGPQRLRERMGPRFLPAGLAAAFADDERRLRELLADVRGRLEQFDRTLADAAALAARKITYQLERLERKAGRAAARASGKLERDAALLENVIYPHKQPQERVYSAISFLARYGPSLLDRVYFEISLEDPDHRVVCL
jgi:bacillithiol biosynthesis cysteine-adding enzyme BshC